jgi:hypothetical protein
MSSDVTFWHHVEARWAMLHLALRFVAGAVTRADTSASCAGSKAPPPLEPGVGAGVVPVLIHIAVSMYAEVAPKPIDIWRRFSPT